MTAHSQLDALLNELASEDEHLEPRSSLEARALEGWDAWRCSGHVPAWRTARDKGLAPWVVPAVIGLAASVLLALVLSRPYPAAGPIRSQDHDFARSSGTGTSVFRSTDMAPSLEAPFMPLGADVDAELAGAFRVSRIRVPRRVLVHLGVLEDPQADDDPVEADVVFSDDGLARAIRLTPRRTP